MIDQLKKQIETAALSGDNYLADILRQAVERINERESLGSEITGDGSKTFSSNNSKLSKSEE